MYWDSDEAEVMFEPSSNAPSKAYLLILNLKTPCIDKPHSTLKRNEVSKCSLFIIVMNRHGNFNDFSTKCLGLRPPSQDRVRAWWSKFQVRSEEWPQQPFDVAGEEMSWSARWSHLSRPGPIVAFHFTNWSKHGQNMIYKPIQYFCVIWKRWSILFSTSPPSVQSSEAPHN